MCTGLCPVRSAPFLLEKKMYSLHYLPNYETYKWYIKDEHGIDHSRYSARIAASKAYEKLMDGIAKEAKSQVSYGVNYLANACVPMSYCTTSAPIQECAQEEQSPRRDKENTMDYNMEVDQRNHLKRRLDSVKSTQTTALSTKFHMQAIYPKTKQELLDALKAGNYFVDPDYYNEDGTTRWGHPVSQTIQIADKDRDEVGYKVAKTALDKEYIEAKDKIIVLSLTDGLAALNAFEATTF